MRNFLNRAGMQKTLEIFETEWYEVSSLLISRVRALPVCASHPMLRLVCSLVNLQMAASRTTQQKELMQAVPVPELYSRVTELEETIRARSGQAALFRSAGLDCRVQA